MTCISLVCNKVKSGLPLGSEIAVKLSKAGLMTSPTVYRWQTPYDSAVLEMDLTLIPTRVKAALQAIEERLRSCIEYGSPEHRAIEDARRSLASLHRKRK
jgi:7,8-dihydro-6-hydroxymethylpterin-pyrophosphokinase